MGPRPAFSWLGLRLVSLQSFLLAKFFSVFHIRLMLHIITNFAPKLYLTWLVWEIRPFQCLPIHLGSHGRRAGVPRGSHLNITCALTKTPNSGSCYERAGPPSAPLRHGWSGSRGLGTEACWRPSPWGHSWGQIGWMDGGRGASRDVSGDPLSPQQWCLSICPSCS